MDNKKTSPPSKLGFNKGSWTAAEDKILLDYVAAHGAGKWGKASKTSGLNRCPRSCRNRWLNYLRPDIKRGNISEAEEDLIVRLHKLLGNRWSLIAGRLPGRTDNEIKNYWHTVLKKKLEVKSAMATATATAKCKSTSTCSTDQLSELHDGNRKDQCIEAVQLIISEDKSTPDASSFSHSIEERRDVFEQLENFEIDQLWPSTGVFDFEEDAGIWGAADSAVFFGDGLFM